MPLPHSFRTQRRQGKVIPFVGAGLSMSVRSKTGIPLFPGWPQLLTLAAEQLLEENKPTDAQLVGALVEKNELSEAAKRAKDGFGLGHWYKFLKAVFDKTVDEADPASLDLPRLIWSVGSNLVITTNYDRVLQWSCPQQSDFRAWDIEAKAEQQNTLRTGNATRFTVWHLHGHIDNVADLILTPDTYTRLYPSVDREQSYKAALATLRALLASHSFLFVGFSLSDKTFLNEMIQVDEAFAGASQQHYALLSQEHTPSREHWPTAVEVITLTDFTRELERDFMAVMDDIGTSGSSDESDVTFAKYYDPGYGADKFLTDIPFYIELAQRQGGPALDIACGTGRILLPIAQAGVAIDGIDSSAAILAIARQKLNSQSNRVKEAANLFQGDMRTFSLGKQYKLALMAFGTLQYVHTIDDQLQALRRVHEHLSDDGLLALNLYPHFGRAYDDVGKESLEVEWTDAQHAELTVRRYFVRRLVNRLEQYFVGEFIFRTYRRNEMIREERSSLKMSYYTYPQMLMLFESAGFDIVEQYGSFEKEPIAICKEMVFVVGKRRLI